MIDSTEDKTEEIKNLLLTFDKNMRYKVKWKEMVQSPCEENGWNYEYLEYE